MERTLGRALDAAIASLTAAVDTPRSDAEELLSRLLGTTRGALRLEPERALTAEQTECLQSWIARRLAGEPVQYITGRAAFRSLDLAVTPSVLIPRPETELLVEAVLEVLEEERRRWRSPRVLDLGTGSGAIALAIASEWPTARVTASDLSDAALEVARGNARAIGLGESVRFLAGDWLEAVDADERFEAVVANPPYVADEEGETLPPDVRDHEPAVALFSGPRGLDALRAIIDGAPRHLVAGGLLALELDATRAEEVLAWLEGSRDWERALLRDDLAGRPRILLARRQSGPAIAPAQWGEDP